MGDFRWVGKSEDGNKVELHRFQGDFFAQEGKGADWLAANRSHLRKAVVVDLETTGLSSFTDVIIEIGAREVFFTDAGEIAFIGDSVSAFSDPGFPLPPEITKITGIRDEDLEGQSIDWPKFEALCAGADFLVAHNAAFDKSFLDLKSKSSRALPWACSLTQVAWDLEGYPSRKLEILAIYHGFFSDAHRALADVDALVHLLEFKGREGRAYFAAILENYRKPLVRLIAANSPFESKDKLKSRGYSWDSERRYWHRKLPKEKLPTELDWITSAVYGGNFRGRCEDIPLERNFS
mgnify:CR=1 FL=1